MMSSLSEALQLLASLSLVLSGQITLVLLLRKPVRALLGSIAGYRLWVLTLLWLPAFALGGKLVTWLQTLQPVNLLLPQPEIAGFELLLNDWVVEPLGNLGRSMSASSSISLDASEVAALLWLAGASAIIARQLHKYRRFSRYLRDESRPAMRTDAPATKLQDIFGDTLPALVLPGINSPALFGIRKPVLLLPESFGESYDSDQQHIILAHEAVHLRRGDNAWNLAAGLVVALNWPNPLFWFAWRCFRLDQELSCDALALKSCTHTQQKRYARTLLDAASTAVGLGPQPMLSAWDNLNDLQERTLMITQHLKNKVSPFFTRCCMSLIATTGAIAMALLAGAFSPDVVAAESVDQRIRTVLEEALALMNDDKLAEARAKLEELEPETPYVRSRVEQIYASVEMKAENYAAARAHLEAALATGGLTEAEKSLAVNSTPTSFIGDETVVGVITHDAFRNPGLFQQLHHAVHGERNPFRRLDHQGIPARDGIRKEPEGDHRWKVERRHDGAHAERLAHHDLINARRDVLGVVALDQGGSAAGHFHILNRAPHFAARLRHGLPALARDPAGQILEMLLQQRFQLEQELHTIRDGSAPPCRVRLLGRAHSLPHFGRRGQRNTAEFLAIRRVEHWQLLGGGCAPCAADVVS